MLRAELGIEIPAGRMRLVWAGFGIPGRSSIMEGVQKVRGDGVHLCDGVTRTSPGCPGFVLPGLQRDLGEVLPPLGGEGRGGGEGTRTKLLFFSLFPLSLCL